MKTVIAVVLATGLFTSYVALARGGDNSDRGTKKWFIEEAVEHAMRLTSAEDVAALSGLQLTIVAEDQILLQWGGAEGELGSLTCYMVDELSRGGTVVKKDLLCR